MMKCRRVLSLSKKEESSLKFRCAEHTPQSLVFKNCPISWSLCSLKIWLSRRPCECTMQMSHVKVSRLFAVWESCHSPLGLRYKCLLFLKSTIPYTRMWNSPSGHRLSTRTLRGPRKREAYASLCGASLSPEQPLTSDGTSLGQIKWKDLKANQRTKGQELNTR